MDPATRIGKCLIADHEFLVSPRARELVAGEGITVIGYRSPQDVWRAVRPVGPPVSSARAITLRWIRSLRSRSRPGNTGAHPVNGP